MWRRVSALARGRRWNGAPRPVLRQRFGGALEPVRGQRLEGGSATLWLLAIGLLVVTVGLAGAAVGAARVARHQAWVAADLGALAGAAHALDGAATACARASAIAARNGGRLTACSLDGFDLEISVEVAVEPLPGLSRVATATARAGPVRA
jgi:secretion/DNA translocation related TadE-like protein